MVTYMCQGRAGGTESQGEAEKHQGRAGGTEEHQDGPCRAEEQQGPKMVSLTLKGQAKGSKADSTDLGGSAVGAATSGGAGVDATDLRDSAAGAATSGRTGADINVLGGSAAEIAILGGGGADTTDLRGSAAGAATFGMSGLWIRFKDWNGL